ncbi:MAG: class I SAM-dependent methyltransferase [Candidatus Baltobacteraceae bacterium]
MEDAQTVKSCCSIVYGSDAARFLLGDSFHPGGIDLTLELASMMLLTPETLMLDVACGKGASALAIAQHFGCKVVGIDLSQTNVAEASAIAAERGLSDRVSFQLADAETLPFEPESFDALLCECAFCTFPDKAKAAFEFHRVLRPGGKVGMSDLTRVPEPLPELAGLLSWVACIGDAQPLGSYTTMLERAGFQITAGGERDHCLAEMAAQIRSRLFLAEAMIGLGKLELPGFDIAQAKQFAIAAAQAVREHKLGYALIAAQRPVD